MNRKPLALNLVPACLADLLAIRKKSIFLPAK
jgi:hypothetical protein